MNNKDKKPTYNRSATEDKILAEFVIWAWNSHPNLRGTWWHTANELERHPGESVSNFRRRLSQAKAKGVLPGVHDVVGLFGGHCWTLEFKTEKGTLKPEQAKFGHMVAAQGGRWAVVRSLEVAQDVFRAIVNGWKWLADPMTGEVVWVKTGEFEGTMTTGGRGVELLFERMPVGYKDPPTDGK